ncbi:MAG: cytochrome P450 [Novosphingobium sp.]|nr:cytochrome P450 [Novosphingobium sp.]
MNTNLSDAAPRPDNVPADRVIDFNLHQPVPGGKSVHEFWRDMIAKADHAVMWTPHNGGHWLVTEPGLCESILADSDHFSSRVVIVPRDPMGETYSNFIPLSLDPPQHGPYRKVLNDNLGPRQVNAMKDAIRDLTVELIAGFREKGHCDFKEDFAEQLPVRIFMKIVNLPEEDLPRLKYLADQFTRPDGSIAFPDVEKGFRDYIGPVISARRGKEGTDLITRIANAEVNGKPLSDADAQNLSIQALVGGLDTVVNLLSFVFSYLATHDDLRRTLASDPAKIDEAMTEFLRRFPVVSDSREARQDIDLDGVTIRKNDMIMASTIPIAMSEESNPDALDFRFDRKVRRHSVFGRGAHTCPGMHLARLELKVVLTEWFARIPEFRLAKGAHLSFSSGIVATVDPFVLEWDV